MKVNYQSYVIYAVMLIVVGTGMFYFGMKYGQHKTPATQTFSFGSRSAFQNPSAGGGSIQLQQNGGGYGRMGGGRGGTIGTVSSVNGNSLIVQLFDGSSKTVNLSSSTTVSKTVSGTASDLTTGESVVVSGSANSDGSVTATSVQIRPAAQQ